MSAQPKYAVEKPLTPDEPAIENVHPETAGESKTAAERDSEVRTAVGDDGDDVEVRGHAVFRYLSRVDPMEPYPKEQIRQFFQSARPVPFGPDGTRWDEDTELVFIRTESGAIQTCYCRSRMEVGLE